MGHFRVGSLLPPPQRPRETDPVGQATTTAGRWRLLLHGHPLDLEWRRLGNGFKGGRRWMVKVVADVVKNCLQPLKALAICSRHLADAVDKDGVECG